MLPRGKNSNSSFSTHILNARPSPEGQKTSLQGHFVANPDPTIPPLSTPAMQVNAIIIDSIVKSGDVAAGGHHFPMPLHRLIWPWSPCGDLKLHGHIHDDGASAAVDAVHPLEFFPVGPSSSIMGTPAASYQRIGPFPRLGWPGSSGGGR